MQLVLHSLNSFYEKNDYFPPVAGNLHVTSVFKRGAKKCKLRKACQVKEGGKYHSPKTGVVCKKVMYLKICKELNEIQV